MPEVVRWWGPAAQQADLLEEDLDDPRMVMRLVLYDGRPFAYVQDYEVHAWPQAHFDHLPAGSRAMDAFIGEPGMIGRGHGSAFLRLRAEQIIAEGTPILVIDPAAENIRARRAYGKAGFCDSYPAETESGNAVVMAFAEEV
jgi:aminoglycoside 6'-N-acetyltransferase